jgi:hypothetical protein
MSEPARRKALHRMTFGGDQDIEKIPAHTSTRF